MSYGEESRENFVELSLSELRDTITEEEISLIDAHQRELIKDSFPQLHENSFIPEAESDEARGRFLLLCINREMYDDEIEEFIDADTVYQALLKEKQRQESNAFGRAVRARRSIAALLFETAKTHPGDDDLGTAA
jgi:hypothetical protein